MAKRSRPAGLSRALGLDKPRGRGSSKSLLKASVSHEMLRRATPKENEAMGYSRTARRYVKAGAKVTKRTASVSARQAETKRTRQRNGFATPEAATRARREGALHYESRAQGERVAKGRLTRQTKRVLSDIEKAGDRHEKIAYDPLGKRREKKARMIRVNPGDAERYKEMRARRLRGGQGAQLDITDFVWLMDMSHHFGDPDAARLRASPGARSREDDDEDAEFF